MTDVVTHPSQSIFYVGEMSDTADALVEFERYNNACVLLENAIVRPQGGWMRMAGTRYIAETKHADRTTMLRGFVAGRTLAYMLEYGDNYLRFYNQQAQLRAESVSAVVTNGTFDSDIAGWVDESGVGGSSAHDATLGALKLTGDGTDEGGTRQAITISETSTQHILRFRVREYAYDTVRVQIGTTTTGADVLASFDARAGWHIIPFTPGAATVHLQFYAASQSGVWVDDVEILSDTPLELTTPYGQDVLRDVKFAQANDIRYHFYTWPTYKLERRGDFWWSLVQVGWEDGPYLEKNSTTTTITPSATTGYVDFTASSTAGINDGIGFTSNDLGRIVRYVRTQEDQEPGWGVIKEITSTTVVKVHLQRDTQTTTGSVNWWLGDWTSARGGPRTGAFHQQRLFAGGTETKGQTVWGSQTADLENFRFDSLVDSELTTEADDAIEYQLAALENSSILAMVPRTTLFVMTVGSEWELISDGPSITTEDIDAQRRTEYGIAVDIEPIVAHNTILFMQAAKEKMLEYDFNIANENYRALDLNALSEHLFEDSTPIEIAWVKEPNEMVLVPREDGEMGVLVYSPLHGIAGWSRAVSNGKFKSAASIPGVDGASQVYSSIKRDEAWVIVERTINGQTKQYIELYEGDYFGPSKLKRSGSLESWRDATRAAQVNAYYVESGTTKIGSGFTVVDGLDHLEGESVVALLDGEVKLEGLVVSDGAVTLPNPVDVAHVGLPYKTRYRSIRINSGTRAGSNLSIKQQIPKSAFYVKDAGPFNVGVDEDDLQEVDYRQEDEAYGEPRAFAQADITEAIISGWTLEHDALRLYVETSSPTPLRMLAISPIVRTTEPPS